MKRQSPRIIKHLKPTPNPLLKNRVLVKKSLPAIRKQLRKNFRNSGAYPKYCLSVPGTSSGTNELDKSLDVSLDYGTVPYNLLKPLTRYYQEFVQRRGSRLKRLKFVLNYRTKRLVRLVQRGLRRSGSKSGKDAVSKQAKAFELTSLHANLSRWLVDPDVLSGGFKPDQALSLFDYRTWLVSSALLHSFNSNGGLRASGIILPAPIVHNSSITAETILRYSLLRLGKYHLPSEIFRSLLNSSVNYFNYTTLDDIRGLSIVCSGRINRKQMASRVKYQIGAASKGTIESPLDYAQGVVSLKYGTIGVKVYLTQNSVQVHE